MTTTIFRLPELWNKKGQPGLWRASKTKVSVDYLLRDPAEPYVPGTNVRRAKISYLGPKLPVVADTEVERLPRELGEFYANVHRPREPDVKPKGPRVVRVASHKGA